MAYRTRGFYLVFVLATLPACSISSCFKPWPAISRRVATPAAVRAWGLRAFRVAWEPLAYFAWFS